MTGQRVDAHQHFWNLNKVVYPWLTPDIAPLYVNFEPRDLDPQRRAAGIDKTVLVQAANSVEDTVAMLTQAEDYDWIGAVVGWTPLSDPKQAAALLSRLCGHPKFRGVRHLIQQEPDPDWIIQPTVMRSLHLLADLGLSLDFGGAYPFHLRHVPALARAVPRLTLVIDHLAGPPIKARQFGAWADQLAAAARFPNVVAKLSGLCTAADRGNWSADDLRPYTDFALAHFGAERLMFGSDWPVCTLAGDYARVWAETNRCLDACRPDERDAILGGTAARVYRI